MIVLKLLKAAVRSYPKGNSCSEILSNIQSKTPSRESRFSEFSDVYL